MFKSFKAVSADIKIDTSDSTPADVYKLILKKMAFFCSRPLGRIKEK